MAASQVRVGQSTLLDQHDDQQEQEQRLSGYFSGTYYDIIKDVCLTGGFYFDRIDDHFYLSRTPLDLSMCSCSATCETSLKEEDLSKIKSMFQTDVDYSLTSSKLLIYGRFYAVKKFREYVLELNEVRRSYVARLVFVRLDRTSISRIEAELKASKLDLISSGYDVLSMFEAQLDCKLSRENSYNYSEQLLYCSDGQKSSLKIGSTFQREQRSVSDYGTSTTTGYQQFEDGVDVELTPYRSINGVVDVQLKFGNSKFQDTESLSKNQVDLNYERLTLLENRLYFVASLNDRNATSGAKILGLSSANDDKVLTCWLVISPVVSVENKRFDDDF